MFKNTEYFLLTSSEVKRFSEIKNAKEKKNHKKKQSAIVKRGRDFNLWRCFFLLINTIKHHRSLWYEEVKLLLYKVIVLIHRSIHVQFRCNNWCLNIY